MEKLVKELQDINNQEYFAKQLKLLLKQKRMTQKTLAAEVGVYISTVHQWTKGYKSPNERNFYKLLNVLDVSYGYFIKSERKQVS